ncbi:MAG: hypothetical protein GY811_05475 [Myxococcales bacterium]|nr:hypothetical protein [Myxococcales bacterium]
MRLCPLLMVTATFVSASLAVPHQSGVGLSSEAVAQRRNGAAKPAPKPDYAAAKRHYAAAEKAAAAKKWNEAAKEYGIAYEITHDPVLFFKLGNAYQLSGDCTRSVEYFERYLKVAKPSEEYRADTKSRIGTCQSSMASSAAAKAGPQKTGDPDPAATNTGNRPLEPSLTGDSGSSDADTGPDALALPTVAAETQPSFMDEEVTWQQTAGWTSVGVSVAFLTASAVLGLSASSREEDMENLLSYRDASGRPADFDAIVSERYDTLSDEEESLNTMSMVALGGAGIGAVAAIVFFVLDGPPEEDGDDQASLRPLIDISPSGTSSVGLGWAF